MQNLQTHQSVLQLTALPNLIMHRIVPNALAGAFLTCSRPDRSDQIGLARSA